MTAVRGGGPTGQLIEITVADFAIIKQLRVRWAPGLCVLTGETGAGKSLLIDAVSATLGRRAEAEWVRTGAARAWVEAIFTGLDAMPGLVKALDEMGCPSDDGILVLGRDLQAGRSTSRVNGRTVPSSFVSGLAETLIDIHSQGDHVALARPAQQLDLLDRYSGLEHQRSLVATAARNLAAARRELEELQSREREAEREALLLRHELADIESAGLRPDEEEELTAARLRGKNALRLRGLADEARRALAGDEGSAGASGLLGEIARLVSEIKTLDASADLDDTRLIDVLDVA
ncbi:MAG TPA: DNA repair protein RecN, partial [Chloroflexota bacterium]